MFSETVEDAGAPPVEAEASARSWPVFGDAEIAAVEAVLRSGKVNAWTGPTVRAFEEAYAAELVRNHAIALANGTVSLEVALRALGIGPGDEVLVPSRSFYASASCVPAVGARPVFCDVDRDSQNVSAATIAPAITARTRAIVVVHLAGWPADMPAIMELARRNDLFVIEDCAQAHGASIAGVPVGAFGDVASFSFCQDKIISTGGEGGLLAMDDDAIWRRAWAFKDHGKSFDAVFDREHPPGFRWLHESFGTNLRMTALQAAIGLVQLERLETTHAERTWRADRLLGALDGCAALRVPRPPCGQSHAYYRAYAFVRPERLRPRWDRERIMAEVLARGGQVFSGSCPEIYRERAFIEAGFAPPDRLPVARELGETSLAFLVDPTRTAAAIDGTATAVRAVVEEATADPGPASGD